MIEPSIQIGGGNWANKSDSLLGYHKDGANFYADELIFSRDSLASYTDANGLIQSMPYNLASYSEQFDNAAWTKENCTISANSTTAPNGIATADSITSTSASFSDILQATSQISGNSYTLSCYAKKGISDWIFLRLTFADAAPRVWFNLNTGVIGTIGSGLTANIESVGDGWFRCSITGTASVAPPADRIDIALANADASTLPNVGNSVYIWGAQLNQGSTALPYFATTTRLNLARVDYKDNINGSLLLESQRTNLALYSEQIDNAAYFKINDGASSTPIVTANYSTSPDGTQNADRVQFARTGTNVGNYSIIGNSAAINLSSIGTFSVYLKSLTTTTQNVLIYWDGGAGVGNVYQVTTEWQRFELNNLPVSTANFVIGTRGGSGSFLNGGDLSVDIAVWGASLEIGSYVSSYIKSEGAATTRLADSCSKTGISDKIGQTEGTLFVDVDFETLSGTNMFVSIRPDASNKIEVYRDINTIYGEFASSSSFNFIASSVTVGRYKIAVAYSSGSSAMYINGILISSNTTAFAFSSTLDDIYINSRGTSFIEQSNYNQVLLFPTRLTNAELATLTTL